MKQNIFKKFCALFIAAAILASIPVFVSAVSYEAESNDTIGTANTISVNGTIMGNILSSNDQDWYKFTIPTAGKVSVNFKHAEIDSGNGCWHVFLYKYDQDTLAKTEITSFRSDGDTSFLNSPNIGLPAGTYYILIAPNNYYFDGLAIDYTLTTTFTASSSWEKEFNDDLLNANEIAIDNSYYGSIDGSTDNDWYKFTIPTAGKVSVNFKHAEIDSGNGCWHVYLYKYDQDTLAKTEITSFRSDGDTSFLNSPNIGLPAGTYYILIAPNNYYFDGLAIDYTLTTTFTASSSWEKEFNDDLLNANEIAIDNSYYGSIDGSTDNDWYKFTIPTAGKVSVNFKHAEIDSGNGCWYIYLYKYNQNTLAKTEIISFKSDGNTSSLNSSSIGLSAGTYYVAVMPNNYYYRGIAIDYSLKVLNPITPSAPKSPKAVATNYNSIKVRWSAVPGATGYVVYRYNASKHIYQGIKVTSATSFTDTYLQTGKTYYYKIKAYKNFSGTNSYSASSATVSATPSLSTPGAFKAARASRTSIKTSWSTVPGATGYVVYRYNPSIKNFQRIKVTTVSSYTNTGLKTGVTYFYKVSAYRSVNGTNVYSTPTDKVWAKT